MIRYIESSLNRGFVKPRARTYKEIVSQNWRDQTFGSLYRKVRYIRTPLYGDSTVIVFSECFIVAIS